MRFKKLQWLFPIAVALHNGEEAVWMPGWDSSHAAQIPVHPPSAIVIRTVLIVFTVAAFFITYMSARKGRESVWAYLTFGYIVAVLVNVFVPHVPVALVFHSYAPGVVTAVLVNLPLLSYLSWLAVRERWVSGTKAVAFGAGVPLLLGSLIVAFFAITMHL